MENLVVNGMITATSKKNDGEFKQEVLTKTAYVSVTPEDKDKLIKFGLTEYTSKDGENYFIIKFPATLMVYYADGTSEKRPDLSQVTVDGVETNNFKTPDDQIVKMNIIKGNHKNNDFFRLQALLVPTAEAIEEIKPENPFADQGFSFSEDDLPF